MARWRGCRTSELAACPGAIGGFAGRCSSRWCARISAAGARCICAGLMLDGKRKSIEPMAARLEDGDEQCLQQFVNQSPWRWEPVRERLALRMRAEIEPEAWVIDDTGFPKFGDMSVGVARQYCGALGKVGNCQIGVSINAVTAQASCPIDWRLFLPEAVGRRPAAARPAAVPDDVGHRPKWQLALDMIDELRRGVSIAPLVLGDAAYGDAHRACASASSSARSPTCSTSRHDLGLPERRRPRAARLPGHGPPAGRALPRRARHQLNGARAGRAGDRDARSRSSGARARAARCARGFSRCGSGRPTSSCAQAATADGRAAGSLAAGRVARRQGRADGLLALQPARRHRRSGGWSAWPSSAGGSSTTTASSKTRSASITSRAAPGPAGTTTSPSSPSPTASDHRTAAPPAKAGGRLTSLYEIVRELQTPPGLLAGHLPHLPQTAAARHSPTPRPP